ncbi:MAG TPA: uroporphyrinogen-III synthase [Burkholderiales bacterium]|nr:uroporphyrinogen-III synthase [Burkholderiales bacterium]
MVRTDGQASHGAPLRGRGIVVTRPAAQARRLADLIAGAGGTPILFPLIDIRAARDVTAARERFARILDYDIVVFVSANAVEHGCALLPRNEPLPPSLCVVAVGAGTARALQARSVARVLVPDERHDSEGVLALPQLADVAGKRVLIVRGVGGRELLAETLTARGAQVDYAECYERMPPSASPEVLMDAWRARSLHAVTITSSEGLRHLFGMLPEDGRAYLRATTIFVTHERMRDSARSLGLDDVVMAEQGDEGLYAALVARYAGSA